MPNLEWFADIKQYTKAETQMREGVYRQFIAAKVVDEWNKVPLINPATPQELEKALLYVEK